VRVKVPLTVVLAPNIMLDAADGAITRLLYVAMLEGKVSGEATVNVPVPGVKAPVFVNELPLARVKLKLDKLNVPLLISWPFMLVF